MTVIVFLSFPLKKDIDDCAKHPCKNNGTCTDRVNGFNCSCAPGFTGTQCEIGNCSQNNRYFLHTVYFRVFGSLAHLLPVLFIIFFSMQVKILCSGACRQVVSTNRVHISFSAEERYLPVEFSPNCLVFDDGVVKASLTGYITQKAINCLFNDKILSHLKATYVITLYTYSK